MGVIIEYFKVVILSFEFIILLIGVVILFFWPELAITLSRNFSDSSEFLKYIALVPSFLAVWVFTESRKLLFPEEDQIKILQSWPDYWKWKIRFIVGLSYSVLYAAMGFAVWALGYKFTEPKGFILMATSLAGQFVVVLSVYVARIKQSEILVNKEK